MGFCGSSISRTATFSCWALLPDFISRLKSPSSFRCRRVGGGLAVLVIAMAICAALGVVIERFAYRPLRRQPKLTMLITAIGVSLFLENAGQFVFGAAPHKFPEHSAGFIRCRSWAA